MDKKELLVKDALEVLDSIDREDEHGKERKRAVYHIQTWRRNFGLV